MMTTRLQTGQGAHAIALHKARKGILVGLMLGLIANGFIPFSAFWGVVSGSEPLADAARHLAEGEYRVTMNCPVRNHQVDYEVRAEHAGSAHLALQWVMPACELAGIGRVEGHRAGETWFRGAFQCEGKFFRKTRVVAAENLRDAKLQARDKAPGCRIETVDQLHCPALMPFCQRQSEDFSVEAKLSQSRLLR